MLCPVCATGARAGSGSHWGYEGAEGPDHWAELGADNQVCGIGQAQTPIDLTHATAGHIEPWTIDSRSGAAKVLNNGHTIQVTPDAGNAMTLDGQRYDLVQFHFHHPSEHRVDGQAFPLECHLVHRAPSGALAVVGVFFKPGAENAALAPIWSVMPATAGTEVPAAAALDPGTLLPPSHGVFRYMGSLTTPPCSEGLVWTVYRTPVEASAEQIAAFSALFPMNARPVQPLNGRVLLSAD